MFVHFSPPFTTCGTRATHVCKLKCQTQPGMDVVVVVGTWVPLGISHKKRGLFIGRRHRQHGGDHKKNRMGSRQNCRFDVVSTGLLYMSHRNNVCCTLLLLHAAGSTCNILTNHFPGRDFLVLYCPLRGVRCYC